MDEHFQTQKIFVSYLASATIWLGLSQNLKNPQRKEESSFQLLTLKFSKKGHFG